MTAPRVWILSSNHAGDNTQLVALARALGYPCEVKTFAYRRGEWLPRMALGATLLGVDLSNSSPIAPPYPDLVLCAGRATEAIARWIKAKCNPGARLVYVGPPWTDPGQFDLVIASPQYRMPPHPHVLNTALPLHALAPDSLAQTAALWQPRFAHLPRPFTAVMVGGGSGPYRFDAAAGERLGRLASAHASQRGGSLLVTTSARTPIATADALERAISVPVNFYRWRTGATDNPVAGYFAVADDLIVSADSISMIAEASATGRPVYLFDTETGRRSMRAEDAVPANGDALPPPHWRGADHSATLWRIGMIFGPATWTRDLRVVHRAVIAQKRAVWLGDPPLPARSPGASPDLALAADRIRAFF